jgi:hypothetical protein
LIENGHLEKCADFEHDGKKVLASRLGYRITQRFVTTFFARIFNHPDAVFTEAMLRPELQGIDIFIDGMDNIIETQKRVAQLYFNDGSISAACPPLHALLHIMAHGNFEGKNLDDPEIRALFTRENLIASDWYAERLKAQQKVDEQLWTRHIAALKSFLAKPNYADEAIRLGIAQRLEMAAQTLEAVRAPDYMKKLIGTIGSQPLAVFGNR